jgi:glycosyltransferase involved in cell wall biosynthesis
VQHFAPHLQDIFRMQTVVGIDNPLFGEAKPAFSERAIAQARAGNSAPILSEKRSLRTRMLHALAEYRDERMFGTLDGGQGKPLDRLPEEIPLFMMFGRLDPGQKGFDLLARAIEAVPRGAARFVLTPIDSGAVTPWLEDVRALAHARAGDVAVYPFRMRTGYAETQAGASFAVMPSLYEPFGAATEAYLRGTPVVARATGGLTSQVADYRRDRDRATGILFRERLPLTPGWPSLLQAATPVERVALPLYGFLVESLADALEEAIELWRSKPGDYGRMLANLHSKAASFSRERAAKAYTALYELACADEQRL